MIKDYPEKLARDGVSFGPSGSEHELCPFGTYIVKILVKIHPDIGITTRAKRSVNMIVLYLIEQTAQKINLLLNSGGKIKTVGSREVQTVVRMSLKGPSGELARHGVSEGTKAVTRFNAVVGGTKSSRAGLIFPVSRVGNMLMRFIVGRKRKGAEAPVYLVPSGPYWNTWSPKF